MHPPCRGQLKYLRSRDTEYLEASFTEWKEDSFETREPWRDVAGEAKRQTVRSPTLSPLPPSLSLSLLFPCRSRWMTQNLG